MRHDVEAWPRYQREEARSAKDKTKARYDHEAESIGRKMDENDLNRYILSVSTD